MKSNIIFHDQPACGFDKSFVDNYTFESICNHLFLDLNSFSNVRFLAESFGCTLALEFASRYPSKINSLTLVGPHFDRHQAQKNIYKLASLIARRLIIDLGVEPHKSEFLRSFLQRKKDKLSFRESSSKKRTLGSEFILNKWPKEKVTCFENEFSTFLQKNKLSLFLQELLVESLNDDLKIFELSPNYDQPLSTEKLKFLAKKYELFFKSSSTFYEVKNCREQALRFPNSPYTELSLDRTNKTYSQDLEAKTDWEFKSRWPLVKQVVEKGVRVNIITGSDDPFTTGVENISLLNTNKNFKSQIIDQVGHSPIYEKPKLTYQLLESVLYEF